MRVENGQIQIRGVIREGFRKKIAELASVRGVTVDTVGVAFPSGGFRDVIQTGRMSLPGGGFVGCEIQGFAWVEASLPKRLSGENVDSLPIEQMQEHVRSLVDEALHFVLPAEPLRTAGDGFGEVLISIDNPRLVRIDLVRDFQLQDPDALSPLLNGLASIPRSGQMKVRRFNDGRSGKAETLRVGPGAWAATLYDKCRETGGLAPLGYLRSEFRLRGRQLASTRVAKVMGPILQISDMTPLRAETLRRMWFDRVMFGNWVGGTSDIWRDLRALNLTDREMLYFVGWWEARLAGISVKVSVPTDLRCRRILADLQPGTGTSKRIRLDYELGHEVLEQ